MLHQYLYEMLHTLLGKIVHQKKLDGLSLNEMLSLDLDDDKILKSAKNIELNFATKEAWGSLVL